MLQVFYKDLTFRSQKVKQFLLYPHTRTKRKSNYAFSLLITLHTPNYRAVASEDSVSIDGSTLQSSQITSY